MIIINLGLSLIFSTVDITSDSRDRAKEYTAIFYFIFAVAAAIKEANTCTGVGGVWSSSACAPTSQPACTAAGGVWDPAAMWTLKGGADLLVVALMQVKFPE
jgi:hypothetical protein